MRRGSLTSSPIGPEIGLVDMAPILPDWPVQCRANRHRLRTMFAPWCPTCRSKMLLGPRRVVSIERGPTGLRTVLRCHCGTLIVWSADPSVRRPPNPPERPPPRISRRW